MSNTNSTNKPLINFAEVSQQLRKLILTEARVTAVYGINNPDDLFVDYGCIDPTHPDGGFAESYPLAPGVSYLVVAIDSHIDAPRGIVEETPA